MVFDPMKSLRSASWLWGFKGGSGPWQTLVAGRQGPGSISASERAGPGQRLSPIAHVFVGHPLCARCCPQTGNMQPRCRGVCPYLGPAGDTDSTQMSTRTAACDRGSGGEWGALDAGVREHLAEEVTSRLRHWGCEANEMTHTCQREQYGVF